MLHTSAPSSVAAKTRSGSYDQASTIASQNDNASTDSLQIVVPTTRKTPEGASITVDEIVLQPLVNSKAPSSLAESPHRRMWNPFWLTTKALIGLAIAAMLILIVTVVLNRISASQNGFPVTHSANRYFWAYLPTSVFVALATLWHQVDHQCRALTPWSELSNGPSPASKTLLLDYVSPLMPAVLWRATRDRHWAVAAATAGSVLLDICILFSTSLLSIHMVTITKPVPDISFQTKLSTTNTSAVLNQPDPAFIFYGIDSVQISPPLGSDGLQAYEIPDFSQLLLGTYKADVETFHSDLRCRIAETNHSISQSSFSNTTRSIINLDISAPECHTQQSLQFTNLRLDWTAGIMRTILGGDNRSVLCGEQDAWKDQHVISLFIVDMQSQYTPNSTSVYGLDSVFNDIDFVINGSTVLLCGMAAALVKQPYEFDTRTRSASSTTYNGTLEKYIDGSLLQEAFYGTLDTLDGDIRPGPQQLFQDTNQSGLQAYLSPFIACINLQFVGLDWPITSLMDPEKLNSWAGVTFSSLMSQVARMSFSTAQMHTYNGTFSSDESRVFIELVPTVVISVCLLLVSVMALLIFRYRPWNVVPRDPNSVLGLAAILASSPTLNQQLQHKSTLPAKKLELSLAQTSFWSQKEAEFEIQCDQQDSPAQANLPLEWWRPTWAHPVIGVLIIFYALALVAALEAIQRVSRSSKSLVFAIDLVDASLIRSLLPALLLIGTKLLFASLAGCIAMFSPFTNVRGKKHLPRHGLLRSSVYKIPVINVVQSLRAKQPNVALCSLAAVCGGFLTIFASGLYNFDYNVRIIHQSIARIDSFNISSVAQYGKSAAKLQDETFSLTNQFNASYPRMTWKNLVYSKIDLDSLGSDDYWYGNVTVAMPAIRGSLNCEFVPQEELDLSFGQTFAGGESYISIFHKNKKVPPECMSANDTYRVDNYSMVMGSMNQAYAASFRQWLPNNETGSNVTTDEQLLGCPNMQYILGYFDMEAKVMENVSAMYCYQTIEQVETNTTFYYPSQTVDDLTPPSVNKSSTIVLQERANYPGMKWFSSVTEFNESSVLQAYDSISVHADVFTQHLLLGVDGVPLEELVGTENRPRLLSAVQHLYGKYMVQPINSQMRVKAVGAPVQYSAIVSMSGWTKIRFTQEETSKCILQVLLSIMAVCGTLAYILTPMRKVLLHSPNSIAGTMTLLAGSQLCSRKVLPQGSEFMDDKELDILLSKYEFTIGRVDEQDDAKISEGSSHGNNQIHRRRYGIEAIETR